MIGALHQSKQRQTDAGEIVDEQATAHFAASLRLSNV
jgi:hypothetical protein